MRIPCLLLGLMLAGCSPGPWGALAGIELASVTVFGRGVVDIGVSAVSGRDCSIVRLDRGQTYCAASDAPPPDTYCTRTLATVDCWAIPPPALGRAPAPPVADTPPPTRAQARYRDAPWPKSLTAP